MRADKTRYPGCATGRLLSAPRVKDRTAQKRYLSAKGKDGTVQRRYLSAKGKDGTVQRRYLSAKGKDGTVQRRYLSPKGRSPNQLPVQSSRHCFPKMKIRLYSVALIRPGAHLPIGTSITKIDANKETSGGGGGKYIHFKPGFKHPKRGYYFLTRVKIR